MIGLGSLLNIGAGSGLKIVSFVISKWWETKQQKELASMNASEKKLKMLNEGLDNVDEWTRWTRRIFALSFCFTYCFAVIYVLIWNPHFEFKILIPNKPSWLVNIFFGGAEQTTINLTSGALLWSFKNFIEIIVGFYFTKLGK